MTIEMSRDLRGWFREQLGLVLERRGLSASQTTRVYLVELLSQPPREALARPLALQLADAVEASGPEKLRMLRELGDAALYLTGFFADHLERRGVTRSYSVAMGERAYATASALCVLNPSEAVRRHVYDELADAFESFVLAFDELRENTVLRTPQDIVKLYDRWRRTRSPRLAERLREEGVFPTDPRGRVLH